MSETKTKSKPEKGKKQGTQQNEKTNDKRSDKLDIDSSGGDTSAQMGGGFNLGDLEKKRQKMAREKKESAISEKPIRKPRKSSAKKRQEEIAEVEAELIPIFAFAGGMVGKMGVSELSPDEVISGAKAFAPLAHRYADNLDEYFIWLAPLVWSFSVVKSRLDERNERLLSVNAARYGMNNTRVNVPVEMEEKQ